MYFVTGANGQLGYQIRKLLGETAVYTDVAELDITDSASVQAYFADKQFDAIINCAAYTAVDRAEEQPELAHKINVDGPRNLALTGIPLVHVSTDYVFSGFNHKPYTEADEPNPQGVYGKTKLDGELAVMESSKRAVILRTSWLYSEFGNNFFNTMVRLGKERDSLNVVFDQIGTPTYAGDLAEVIVALLPRMKDGVHLYHYSNEGVCSWYDFAAAIMKQMGLTCKVNPIESKDYPTKATRPFYSVLNKAKIKSECGIAISCWHTSLMKCTRES
jgi:dTDP-4-dehydrorhamnose reductase